MIPGPVALVVLDGWGLSNDQEGNAIAQARTPRMDGFLARYPHTTLRADGEAVGLLSGQMGNSNVGHLNLGAGRVVFQDATRIHRSIENGEFFKNQVLLDAMQRARDTGRPLHLMGLVSDGGVHSHTGHIEALLRICEAHGLKDVYLHAFLDGRDAPPRSAEGYLSQVQGAMDRYGTGRIATLVGRYFAMDRDNRWERTEKAYRALVLGEGVAAPTALEGVRQAYARGESDEFVEPTIVIPGARIQDQDVVIFFNYRADRARQLAWSLAKPGFDAFPVKPVMKVSLVTMTGYDDRLDVPVAYPRFHLENTLGELVSRQGWRQLRIAETEKYAHVTYFFNGGEEKVFPGEERVLIPSPKVATYDLQPEMSAPEVTDKLLKEMETGGYRFVVLNFANPDMVGHSGNMAAAIQAIETVDHCLGRVVDALVAAGGAALIVSDHGNAERMVDAQRAQAHTAHTPNPVPCILVGRGVEGWRLRPGTLSDVAPTILELLGLPAPVEMDGRTLIAHRGARTAEQPVAP